MGKKTYISLWSIAAVCAALLVAELWVRANYADVQLPPAPNALSLPDDLVQQDPILGYHFVPNASKFFASVNGEFKVNYQINEVGLRDSGMFKSGPKQPLVVILGDALVEGWGVMPEATFILEMQRQLRFQKGAKIYPRIVNAGMTGFGAAQSYLLGKQLIEKHNPQAVVFAYSSLMPTADFRFLEHAELNSAGLATNINPDHPIWTTATSGPKPWLAKLILYDLLNQYLAARRARDAVQPGNPENDIFAAARGPHENNLALHQQSLKYVAALADIAAKRGIKFVLLHIPLPHQVAVDEWAEGRVGHKLETKIYPSPESALLETLCAEKNIHCAMPLPIIKQLTEERSSPVYFRHDYALTEVGHAAIVDFLIDTVRGLLGIELPKD